jgi:hypothetical protein
VHYKSLEHRTDQRPSLIVQLNTKLLRLVSKPLGKQLADVSHLLF